MSVTTGEEFNKDAKKAFARIMGDWFKDGAVVSAAMMVLAAARTTEQQAVVDRFADFKIVLVALDPIQHAEVLAKRKAA